MRNIYNRSAEYIAALEKKHGKLPEPNTEFWKLNDKYLVFVGHWWYWDYYQLYQDNYVNTTGVTISSIPIPPHNLEIDESCPYIQCLAYYFPEDAKELGVTTANRYVPVDMESVDIMNLRPLSSKNRISAHLDYYQLTGRRLFPHEEESIIYEEPIIRKDKTIKEHMDLTL